MEENFEIEQLMSQYLSGDLTPEEAKVFERNLSEDTDLKARFDEFSLLRSVFAIDHLHEFEATSKDFLSKQRRKEQGKKWGLLGLGLATVAGIIIGVSSGGEEEKSDLGEFVAVAEKIEVSNGGESTIVIENTENTIPEDTQSSEGKERVSAPIDEQETSVENIEPVDEVNENTNEQGTNNSTPDNEEQTSSESGSSDSEPVANTEQGNNESGNKDDECIPGQLSFKHETVATCRGENGGAITITKIKGGRAPYSYEINGEASDSKILDELEAGNYTVEVTDAKACSTSQIINVPTKQCIKEHTGTLDIGAGETFDFPIPQGATGTVMVFNEAGRVVYQTSFTDADELSWDGQMTNNSITTSEQILYYLVKLSSGDVVRGEITVFNH